jgi:hypothetical protein
MPCKRIDACLKATKALYALQAALKACNDSVKDIVAALGVKDGAL